MFRFANPEYFYLLATVLLLAVVYLITGLRDRRRRHRLGDIAMLRLMAPDYSRRRRLTKFILMECILVLAIIMLARPQFGLIESKDTTKGIEAAFIIDVSNSMYANDVRPNRIERSKLLISTLLDRMPNDKIALGVFAGEAYPQLPITNDFTSAKLFLDNITPGMVTLQGTNIAAAIELATISFTDKKDVGKAIVIVTDGEDHQEGAIDAAKKAHKEGYRVYVLGIGSPTGSNIKLPDGSLMKDSEGNVIVTKLNEKMCREVAEAGGGNYYHIDNTGNAGEHLKKQFEKLLQADNTVNYKEYDEQFRAIALIILFLILAEMFIMEAKNPRIRRLKLFGK